ncbi:MAG: hypothetical protein JNJ40_07275 [Bacteroidia bacterium]|nr:hypothetical protein [Bacteroidia bacterium]
MKNQEQNNNLDQLFNKAKADKQSLDDFEKDAFAGFEMLESEQEAKNLKAALDTRINKELFNKEERNPTIYWFAAAGLALVIGLTVLFISNTNDEISSGSNMAISNPEQKVEEKISIDSKTELKEQNVTPIEAATGVSDEAPAKEIIQNNNGDALKQDEPAKIVKQLEAEKEGVKSRMIVPAAKNEISKDGYFKNEKDANDQEEKRKENVASGTVTNIGGNNDKSLNNFDDLAKNDKAKQKESSDYKYVTSTKKTDQNKVVEDAEVNVQDELASTEGKKGKLDEKNKDADLEQSVKQPVVVANSSTNATGRDAGKSKHYRAKKTAEKQSSNAGPGDIAYSSTPKSTATQEVSGEVVAAVPAEAENKPSTTCFYTGGESAITKDLKEKLKAENTDQKFDAILYVNEKKVVEKVEFTNAYDLTTKQKEEVTKILKSLSKFNVPASQGKKENFTYKLLYRP